MFEALAEAAKRRGNCLGPDSVQRVIAIAESELRDKLAFKGGTALKRAYYPDYRFSEDLDFTLCVDLSEVC